MTIPILFLPYSLLPAFPFAVGWTAPLFKGRHLFEPLPAACKVQAQEAFCITLLKLFLNGSAVAVVTL